MITSVHIYDYKKVYFVQVNKEKVIRKMIITNEELLYKDVYDYYLKRTFTIAGIGEVVKYTHHNGNINWVVNGNKVDEFTFKIYTDLNGTSFNRDWSEDLYKYHEERFANANGIFHKRSEYGGYVEMYMWEWDGINAVKRKVSLYNFLKCGDEVSLISPTFDKKYFKSKGFYLTKEECENDNVVEVVDFSF
jgi:hypothetical protein